MPDLFKGKYRLVVVDENDNVVTEYQVTRTINKTLAKEICEDVNIEIRNRESRS